MNVCRYAAVLAALVLCTSPALADNHDVVYTEHSVWDLSWVETHPGHFDDYLVDLDQGWRKSLEIQKQDGRVLSYRMLAVGNPRDGEPNLLLMVEYPNMAALDAGREYFDEVMKKVFGDRDATQQASIKRGDIRTLRGGLLARELVFTD